MSFTQAAESTLYPSSQTVQVLASEHVMQFVEQAVHDEPDLKNP